MANSHFYGPVLRHYGTVLEALAVNPKIRVLLEDGAGAAYTGAVAAGDVKVSKNGGAEANIATLPTHLFGGIWEFVLDATEMAAYTITVRVSKAGIALTVILVETTLTLGRMKLDATPIGGNTHGAEFIGVGTGSGVNGTAGGTGRITNFFDTLFSGELSALPSLTVPSVAQVLQFLFQRFALKRTYDRSANELTMYKNDGVTKLAKETATNSGTVQTVDKVVTP